MRHNEQRSDSPRLFQEQGVRLLRAPSGKACSHLVRRDEWVHFWNKRCGVRLDVGERPLQKKRLTEAGAQISTLDDAMHTRWMLLQREEVRHQALGPEAPRFSQAFKDDGGKAASAREDGCMGAPTLTATMPATLPEESKIGSPGPGPVGRRRWIAMHGRRGAFASCGINGARFGHAPARRRRESV
ncbi:hypothetical protein BU16DRAFT_554889 [Lophium mytilinum]|uniref:Uncharacterized protein n=1 Tax=Lophium mytilinum TaxID=390894 RepID=A0A6A6RHC1_9PEZI|nr:hypothetical protein BU16DRAFT_554889 [Lophium mytilinum]